MQSKLICIIPEVSKMSEYGTQMLKAAKGFLLIVVDYLSNMYFWPGIAFLYRLWLEEFIS